LDFVVVSGVGLGAALGGFADGVVASGAGMGVTVAGGSGLEDGFVVVRGK